MMQIPQEKDVIDKLMAWGTAHPLIRAMILTSSRTRPDGLVDLLSDYDLILAVGDVGPFDFFRKNNTVLFSQRTTGGGTLSARVRLRRDPTAGGCMHIEIVPFRDTHLEEAADLLALRHQGDHALEPALPLRFKQSAAARAAVEATWRKPDASGVVALYSGRMIGYLIGVPRIDLVWGRSVWVPLAGHAVDRTYGAEMYRDLYAALSPSWVALGCYAHYALIPASDRPALEAWFALSFGKEQAHGIRETAPASALTAPVDPTLTIRRAELADLEASLELDEIIPRQQSRAPVYAPYWFGEYAPFGDIEAIRQESLEILQDEQAKLWLALRNGRMVGYQLYVPASPEIFKIDDIMVPEQCCYLAVAATREEEQGRGVGRALTAYGLAAAQIDGYTHCITDWRVTNLLSSRFWPRQGFRPVAYRLSRRLDERIAWAHEEPSPSPWLPRTAPVFPAKFDRD